MSQNKVKQMMNFLNYSNEVAKALNYIGKVNSFQYKKFFIVPKVKVIWRMASGNRNYGGLYFTINRKPVRGWIQFDSAYFFETQKETQRWLDRWLSQRLTPVINSMEVGASMNKTKTRKIVEQMYNVKVKVI